MAAKAKTGLHILSPRAYPARTVRRCTTCKRRRRFVVQFFEWYPSVWMCGGCGHTWFSGEGRQPSGDIKRRLRRAWVKRIWPDVASLDEVVRAMMDDSLMFE